MYQPEFVALQVTVLIRSDQSRSGDIQTYLESLEFKSEMQQKLAHLFQGTLRADNLPFDEIIISLDRPPQRARPVEKKPSDAPTSWWARLFGKK